jgi:ABC-type lipoprotein export system ATPase subunit
VGFVLQDFPLVEYLDVTENVLLPFRISPALRLDAAARARAAALLDRLGLSGRARRRPAALSQGERQRVAIARALVTEPALLLADEPTAGLDPARAAEVVGWLQALRAERGLTLVLVSHDPAALARFGRRLELPA